MQLHLLAPRCRDKQPRRCRVLLLTTDFSDPLHSHSIPPHTNLTTTTEATNSLILFSLNLTPLLREADGHQPLQFPPNRTRYHRPGCARLFLLHPTLLASIRWKEGTCGRKRAPSFACEISRASLTRSPLHSTSLPEWVFEYFTQSWLPSTSDSSASRSSRGTAKTTHSTTPNRFARSKSTARLDRAHRRK